MLKRNTIANFAGQGWAALMSLVFVPLYIYYLGIEAYGVIGLFVLLQAWLVLLDLGMTPTLNREMARFTAGLHTSQEIRDLLRSLEIVAGTIAIIVALAIAGASPLIAHSWVRTDTLDPETVAQAIAVMGLIMAMRLPESLYRSSMIGLQRQVLYNAIFAATATLRGGGVVLVLAFWSPTLQAFFLWQALASFISLTLLGATTYAVLPKGERRACFSMPALRGIGRFAGGMVLITFLALLLTQMDKVLLSGLVPLEEFGHYALAGVVAGALYLLAGPISTAVGPRLAELVARNDLAAQTATYHTYAQLLTVIVVPAAIVLAFFSKAILLLWTGDAALTTEVAPLLSLVVIGTMLNALMQLPYALTLAYGWTQFAIATNACAVAILVPAIFFVVPHYGTLGAAAVWLALNVGYVVLAIPFLHRRLFRGEMRRWYLDDTLAPLTAVLLVVGLLRLLVPRQTMAPIESVLILAIVAFFAQMTALLVTETGRRILYVIWGACRRRFAV